MSNKRIGGDFNSLFDDNNMEESEGLRTLRLSEIEPNKGQPRKIFDKEAMACVPAERESPGGPNFESYRAPALSGRRLGRASALLPEREKIRSSQLLPDGSNRIQAWFPAMSSAWGSLLCSAVDAII